MYILYPREDFADQIRLFLGSFLERREGGGSTPIQKFPKTTQFGQFPNFRFGVQSLPLIKNKMSNTKLKV